MNGLTIKPGEGFIRTVADQSWHGAGVGDFDGDGKADVLVPALLLAMKERIFRSVSLLVARLLIPPSILHPRPIPPSIPPRDLDALGWLGTTLHYEKASSSTL